MTTISYQPTRLESRLACLVGFDCVDVAVGLSLICEWNWMVWMKWSIEDCKVNCLDSGQDWSTRRAQAGNQGWVSKLLWNNSLSSKLLKWQRFLSNLIQINTKKCQQSTFPSVCERGDIEGLLVAGPSLATRESLIFLPNNHSLPIKIKCQYEFINLCSLGLHFSLGHFHDPIL